jgi:hypothetical protein
MKIFVLDRGGSTAAARRACVLFRSSTVLYNYYRLQITAICNLQFLVIWLRFFFALIFPPFLRTLGHSRGRSRRGAPAFPLAGAAAAGAARCASPTALNRLRLIIDLLPNRFKQFDHGLALRSKILLKLSERLLFLGVRLKALLKSSYFCLCRLNGGSTRY